MNTDEKIASLRAEWVLLAGNEFDGLMGLCESPIERLFLGALLSGTESDGVCDDEAEEPEFTERFAWIRLVGQPTWKLGRDWVLRVHGIDPPINMFTSPDYGPPIKFTFPDYAADDRFWELIVPQVSVSTPAGKFRVDFAILDRTSRIAIELDGHDFHERTKEQAQRDKARDRALTKAGWLVIRFTGSEVFADAHRCVDEALALSRSRRERLILGRR